MNIFLIGYMASGKSTIGSLLANKLNFNFIDFDQYIEEKVNSSIKDIFENQGEIYFRNKESLYLKELSNDFNNTVISLGGGTPCYGNNLTSLLNNKNNLIVYLKASVNILSKRLMEQKTTRPLVNHIQTLDLMNEFVGKHLFERQFYYNQAQLIIETDNKSKNEIIEDVITKLF